MALVTNTFLKANVPYRVGPGANDMRTFSTDELAAYVTNTRRMMREGGMAVPVLSEHAPPGTEEGGPVFLSEAQQFADAIKTAGWLKDVRFDPSTGEAQAFYEITSKPYLNAIQEGSIRFTSPELRETYTDGLGRSWGQTFAHFALTPKPRNPAQTQLSAADGVPQFAMQFSMADAVGFDVSSVSPLQFAVPVAIPARRNKRGQLGSAPPAPGSGVVRRLHSAAVDEEGNDEPDSGPAKPMSRNRGGNGPSNSMTKWGGKGRVRPETDVGGPDDPNEAPSLGRRPPRGSKYNRRGKMPGVDAPLQGTRQLSEQFDYSLQDAGMGWPGPVPQMNTQQGPFGSGNVGLEAALGQMPQMPPQNPDVLNRPDEAKRQKSEAITQLCGQLGIQMPADTDWTALDDGVLNAFLASLKTLIDAESRYEQDMQGQQQDMQLKEQVPMANQMSEDYYQFAARKAAAKPKKKKAEPEFDPHVDHSTKDYKPRDSQVGMRWKPAARSKAAATWGKRKKSEQRIRQPKTSSSISMSEDTNRLNRRLAATKARLDGNSRHGLAQYVQNAPLPAGVKKHLMAKVGGVQFSTDGQPLPTFTIQEVVKILSAAVPPQFSEQDLLEAADPRANRSQQQVRRDLARRLGDKVMNEDGIQMSEGEIDAYYDKKFTDPTWAKMSVNGHSGSH